MAIKVKHDGNVTSRIYASAAGGKGKRQAEDAIKLAQLQASASGRGGTGGGGGASAHAPTIQAPTAHAPLGSPGSIISPQMSPGTRMRLADDALNNQLIEQDFAAGIRAAEQKDAYYNRWSEEDRQLERNKELMRERARLESEAELTTMGRKELAELREQVIQNYKNFGEAELPELMKSLGFAEDRIKALDRLRTREPTEQEKFERGIVIDADGNRFVKNARGDYVPLPNLAAEAQAMEQKRQQDLAKQQEAAQQKLAAEQAKAAQARAAHRQKFIDAAIDNARKNSLSEGGPTTEELIAARDAAAKQYDELYPAAATPTPTVTPQPAPVTSDTPAPTGAAQPQPVARTVEDAKKKWGVKR